MPARVAAVVAASPISEREVARGEGADIKAQSLRTVIISQADLADVQVALAKLSNGDGLTALESGLVAEDPISNLSLVDVPEILFDGFKWNVFLFVSSG